MSNFCCLPGRAGELPCWFRRTAAADLNIEFQSIPALSANQLAEALTSAAMHPPDALIVLSPIYAAYRNEVVDFATKTKVPLSFDTRGLAAEPGALLSYGADISALLRRAATFVDKILKGANPADLPVEQPTKFELVINLKTATALGLTVPPFQPPAPTRSSNDPPRTHRAPREHSGLVFGCAQHRAVQTHGA